jgi:hypothetical protein
MTTVGAFAHAAVVVSHGRERDRSLLVTAPRGSLRTRQADSSITFGCQGGNRQQRGNNDAQNKTHEGTSVFTLTHRAMFWMQRP